MPDIPARRTMVVVTTRGCSTDGCVFCRREYCGGGFRCALLFEETSREYNAPTWEQHYPEWCPLLKANEAEA